MKHLSRFFLFLCFLLPFGMSFAEVDNEDFVVPENLDLTKRYILAEIRDLRIEVESLRREYQLELNKKQIETIDKALSYSANTVNYFFILITITVMGISIFGWKSIRDVKKSLNTNFEKKVEKNIYDSQRKLHELEKEQIRQSQQALLNQENIMKKQESAYLWSQYNLEDSLRDKLKFLDAIGDLNIQEEVFLVQKEKSHLYIGLEMWEKALNICQKSLEEFENETTFMMNEAIAFLMLNQKADSLRILNDVITLDPSLKDALLSHDLLKSVRNDIEKM